MHVHMCISKVRKTFESIDKCTCKHVWNKAKLVGGRKWFHRQSNLVKQRYVRGRKKCIGKRYSAEMTAATGGKEVLRCAC